jgi:glycerophosphoryl diester phosphodiesterase
LKRCIVIGHRGARGLFPENTLAGFAGALASGADMLEMDVGLTADGIVVVSHDPALNPDITRDSGGAWLTGTGPAIRAMRAADLARYDVGRPRPGSAYAALFPDQQPQDGARIPSLDAVLAQTAGAGCIVEMKTFPADPARSPDPVALAEAVAAVADARGAIPRISIESFDWRGPRHLRRLRPDVRLAWLTSAETVRDAGLWWDGPRPEDFGGSVPRAVAAEGGPVWAPDYRTLTAELVAEAHALGLGVMPWTVNQPEAMRRLIAWGVDGLVTDRPDLARQAAG